MQIDVTDLFVKRNSVYCLFMAQPFNKLRRLYNISA